ncbi:MAG: TonB family protein [Polyangiaceae bacterium]
MAATSLASLVSGVSTASAQMRGSDVGGAPSARRVTKLPVLVHFEHAIVPDDAAGGATEAHVVLVLDVSATGEVTAVTVGAGVNEVLDRAAREAALKFRFEPAEVAGKAAPSKITYRYDFAFRPVASPASTPAPEPSPAPAGSVTTAPAAPPSTAPSSPTEDVEDVRVSTVRPRTEAIRTVVGARDARLVAGTQGDVLKVVQNLPGVSRPPVASGQLVVWGSAPNDTRVYVDGVEIPALYHGSGLRGTVSSDLVSTIELVPGAFGAAYGRGLGGLVRVETRDLPNRLHGTVAADTLDGSAIVAAPLGERTRVAIAGRGSWLDGVLSLVSAPDVGDFFPIPKYGDFQLKSTVKLGARESLDAVVLGSFDALTRTVPSPDPAAAKSERTTNRFERAYVRWSNTTDGGDVVTVTPFVGFDATTRESRFGGVATDLGTRTFRFGVRANAAIVVARSATLSVGLDLAGSDARARRRGSLTLPPREGDRNAFGQVPSDETNGDAWEAHVVNLAPYAQVDVRWGKWTFTPGVRFETFFVDVSRKTPRVGLTPGVGGNRYVGAVDPRLAVRFSATRELTTFASLGTYHQPPAAEDLSAVFGTPELGTESGLHATVGESFAITRSTSLEVTGFAKELQDLTTRTRAVTPRLARALVQDGVGRSYGVQVLLRQELWRGFFGWVSYAASRSLRRYDGDPSWRLFDFDQPHVLSVVASQDVGAWSFGARFRYASGMPRTPVVGGYYDARRDSYDPIFGDTNATRLPPFVQLDLRVERTFAIGSTRLSAFADVQNVTAQKNTEEFAYRYDYRSKGAITGLPTLAVIGGRFDF